MSPKVNISETFKVSQPSVNMGCDPEAFIRRVKDNRLVHSGVVIPKEGYIPSGGSYFGGGTMVRDGVQVEFHPGYGSCTGSVSLAMDAMIQKGDAWLRQNGYYLDFSRTVELTEEEWKSLPSDARQLGCQESQNVYDPEASVGVGPDYRFRSGGGHFHIGFCESKSHPIWERRADIVPICDILVGNTCVLLDRDEGNKIRRQTYGRAGEYRIQPHGLEYRTLSNFWLRSFPLFNFCLQMTRAAHSVAVSSLPTPIMDSSKWPAVPTGEFKEPAFNFAADLIRRVDIQDIRRAINTNDFDLALTNFMKIVPFIEMYFYESGENSGTPSGSFPLSKTKIEDFLHFVHTGMDKWFDPDPVKDWKERFVPNPESKNGYTDPGHSRGWNSFLTTVVRPERKKAQGNVEVFDMKVPAGVLEKEAEGALHV